MSLLFSYRGIINFSVLIICVLTVEGRKHHRKHISGSLKEDKDSKSTFITIRIPAHVATHKQDCIYEGMVRHHGDAWSPGPCIPECRCKHGHVQCSKLECPDLNCDKSIKRKWKCCPECLPGTDNGTSCGVWTKEGNANGGCCVFPFHYNGVMYYTCTYQDHDKPWCSITMNYDSDGVWGECIDKGDSKKSMKYKHHKKKQHKLQDDTDALVSNIANSVTSSMGANGNTSMHSTLPPVSSTMQPNGTSAATAPGNTTAVNTTAAPATASVTSGSNVSSVTGNTTGTPLPSSATNTSSVAGSAGSVSGVTGVASGIVSAQTNVTPAATSVNLQPSPVSVQLQPANSSAGVAPNATVGTPIPSTLGPSGAGPSVVPTQVSGAGQQGAATASLPSPPVSPQPLPVPAPQPQPGQTVLPGQQGVTPTPPLGITVPPVPSGPPPIQQPTSGASQQPSGQQSPAIPYPVEETTTPGSPWPITQTTLTSGQTQGGEGQAVHQMTMHEYGASHNTSTSEYWFGKPNETLNRTSELANGAFGNQTAAVAGNGTTGNLTTGSAVNETIGNITAGSVGNETLGNQTTRSLGNETIGNQTSVILGNGTLGNQTAGTTGNETLGNQTAGTTGNETLGNQTTGSAGNETVANQTTGSTSNETTQTGNMTADSQYGYQNLAQYTEQQSQTGYTSYSTPGYEGYNDYPGYQQYPGYQEYGANQTSYYSNEQYQNEAEGGSYYAG